MLRCVGAGECVRLCMRNHGLNKQEEKEKEVETENAEACMLEGVNAGWGCHELQMVDVGGSLETAGELSLTCERLRLTVVGGYG